MGFKLSSLLGLKIQDDDETCSIVPTAENFEKVDGAIKADRDRITAVEKPTVTQASTLSNFASGDSLPTLFGKVKKAIAELINHLGSNGTHANASGTKAGFMSSENYNKLAGIDNGAQRNTVYGVRGSAKTDYQFGYVTISPDDLGIVLPNITSKKFSYENNDATIYGTAVRIDKIVMICGQINFVPDVGINTYKFKIQCDEVFKSLGSPRLMADCVVLSNEVVMTDYTVGSEEILVVVNAKYKQGTTMIKFFILDSSATY